MTKNPTPTKGNIMTQHNFITEDEPTFTFTFTTGTCPCDKWGVECRCRDRSSIAEFESAFKDHPEVTQ